MNVKVYIVDHLRFTR